METVVPVNRNWKRLPRAIEKGEIAIDKLSLAVKRADFLNLSP